MESFFSEAMVWRDFEATQFIGQESHEFSNVPPLVATEDLCTVAAISVSLQELKINTAFS
jgi:hypothetical protein